MRFRLIALAIGTLTAVALAVGGCSGKKAAPASLIDPNYPAVVAGQPGYGYHAQLAADLNGDGSQETVHVLARAERIRPGEYAWDDGADWHVYVEEGDKRTHVYSRWVQLGRLQVMLSEEAGKPALLILEQQGAGIGLHRVIYTEPGKAEAFTQANAQVLNYATEVRD